jgi:hypothetical protein
MRLEQDSFKPIPLKEPELPTRPTSQPTPGAILPPADNSSKPLLLPIPPAPGMKSPSLLPVPAAPEKPADAKAAPAAAKPAEAKPADSKPAAAPPAEGTKPAPEAAKKN